MGTIFEYNTLEKEIKSLSPERIQNIMTTFYETLKKPFAEQLLKQLKATGQEIPPALLNNFTLQMKS
ncbi:MAG: hypothetical protein LBD75_01225 [Candidatus Peribacteria bacterium]|jgi:ABC-type transporter MlaC component|nr:hypothetical protein [Candidatus Peribacteria bacterium]